MYTAVCIIYIYRYLYTYTCLCIYISASRKLRLQRSAVYCLSWLFFFSFLPIFFLRIRFSLFSSPFSQPVSSSSFHPCLTLSISFPRPFSLFFFRLSKILQHLSSSEANTRPRVRHQLSRFRRRFLFPLVRRGWQFRGMSHRGACEALERRGLRIYAERHARRVQLFRYKFVHFLFHLLHGGEFPFPEIVERMRRGRLEVPRVLSQASAGRVTARAHARMISQSPLVQIRMRQCIHHGDPLVGIED